MEELLAKANVDKVKLKNYITRTVAEELSKLSEPCYYPPWKKDFNEILGLTGLTQKDIKDFVNRFHIKTQASDYIIRDLGVNIILFCLHYFLLQKDPQAFMTCLILLSIKFYSNRMNIHVRNYCNPDIFRYTLDNISKTNLISREKTIPNFLFFIAKEMQRRYKNELMNFNDPVMISKFVYECRHRIAQTMKSFFELYYKYSKESGGGYRKQEEESETGTYEIETFKKGHRLIEDVVTRITMYKDIDRKIIDDARKLTRINAQFADLIATSLCDLKYADNLKLIFELFIKNLTSISQLCGPGYFKYTKDLMGIKRTNETIYFKQQIALLTEKIIKDSKYKQSYEKLTNQTKFLIQSYTSFYLTMYFRKQVC